MSDWGLDLLEDHLRSRLPPSRRGGWRRRKRPLRIKILAALLRAGDRGLTTPQLAAITVKYRARISELRQDGVVIVAERIPGSDYYRYRIANPEYAREVLERLSGGR